MYAMVERVACIAYIEARHKACAELELFSVCIFMQGQSESKLNIQGKPVQRVPGGEMGGLSVPNPFSIRILSGVSLALPLIPVVPSCFTKQGYTT